MTPDTHAWMIRTLRIYQAIPMDAPVYSINGGIAFDWVHDTQLSRDFVERTLDKFMMCSNDNLAPVAIQNRNPVGRRAPLIFREA